MVGETGRGARAAVAVAAAVRAAEATLAEAKPSGDNAFNPRVTWSLDGRRLAASNWDGSVSIWDAAERSSPAAKRAHYQAAEERAGRP